MEPFWPRRSPNFALLRAAVREFTAHPVAVGLSGGPDSLALAAALAAESSRSSHRTKPPLAICVDHGLQEGSADVAAGAAAKARSFGLRAQVVRVAAGSGEASARIARYRALATFGLPVMAAHTAEDQAETLLLGALRGFATGMAPESEVEGCRILRPLLHLRRAHTEAACSELGLEPWLDPHNDSADFRRVRVRKEVLPLLADIVGGDAVAPLAAAGDALAADNALLATPASNDIATLVELPAPQRSRAIKAWLLAHGVDAGRASLEAIGRLVTNWHGQGPVAVKSSGNPRVRLEVKRQGGKLALLPGTISSKDN
ncbi:hypothetical protein CPHO_10730 [Corynebacterium phocae]|uniref:tRNA(Ile)-lysidine synthase n=1 Tax=Corynebacterium phocae TaxID=161895 RepID=A0A1L7D538_9CORY|nr:tRNA lysidine(34) synthetase TilS [Corynebacterium phocae]APT93286.1 hypothetical protein CPHO_10730 [Corynebacterium phocae]KAA8721614.1 tRNA lysidine(34) synthetase TilS [Corynebacterium phocae]